MDKKILLVAINAKYIHSNLAVHSLKAYAREYEANIKILEYTINNRVEEILEGIYKENADVIAFSCYIWNISYVIELSELLKKVCKDVLIWVGGPEVSYEIDDFMYNNTQIDGVMVGEGEKIFKNLCRYYIDEKGSLEDIPGIAYREDYQIDKVQSCMKNADSAKTDSSSMKNADSAKTDSSSMKNTNSAKTDSISMNCREIEKMEYRVMNYNQTDCMDNKSIKYNRMEEVIDMSTIPFCYNDITDFENRIIYYESSRGCPFNCSYCLSSVDKKLRFRDIELVKKELKMFVDNGVKQVKFVDRTFNCNHKHAMEIWKYIKEIDRGITNFHFEVAADLLNDEEIEFIATMREGLIQLEIGVQSTNLQTITEIHRKMDLEKVKSIVKRIQKVRNIHQHLDLIAGLPYEDYETFAHSFDEIYELKPEQLQLGFLKVLKGSYMFEHADEYEIVYRNKPPYEILSSKWLSYDDVLRIKQVEEMLEVYYNSGQFSTSIRILENAFDSAFEMFQKFGEFYEEKGYFKINHSRIRRCEIMLEFAEIVDKEHIDMYKQALTIDLYLRENMKSRPGFATDLSAYKDLIRKYCTKGKLRHLEPLDYKFEIGKQEGVYEYPKKCDKYYIVFNYEVRDNLLNQVEFRCVY